MKATQKEVQLTIRGVDPELRRRLEREAERRSLSLNRCIIALLREAAELDPKPRPPRRYHDLDHLAGGWSREEADEFDRHLRAQRVVDPKLWS